MMFDDLEFTVEEGKDINHDVTVFALSTCGFCKRSMEFLREKEVKFKFLYIDKLPFEQKQDIKERLKEKFNKRAVFPYLVIDEKDAIVGFTQSEWEESLGL